MAIGRARVTRIAFASALAAAGILLPSASSSAAAVLPACAVSGATGAGSPAFTVNVPPPVAGGGDSSGEIEAAINTAKAAGGGTVVLQAGTYTMADDIAVWSGVDLRGQGEGVTVLQAAPSISLDPVVTTWYSSNVTIENLTVNQDGEAPVARQDLSYYMVEARGGSNVIIQDVATREPTTYSIAAVGTSHFCFRGDNVQQDPAENGKFNQLDGIHILNSSYGDVTGNYVDNSYGGATGGDDGIVAHAYGGTVAHVAYTGNVVRGGWNGDGMGVWIAGSGSSITGITVTGNEFWGEGGIHPGSSRSLAGSSFTGNILHDNYNGIVLAGSGLTVTGNYLCSSGTVTVTGRGNTVSGNPAYTGCTDAPSTMSPPPAYPPP
jgi:polygalacturonase